MVDRTTGGRSEQEENAGCREKEEEVYRRSEKIIYTIEGGSCKESVRKEKGNVQ